MATVKVKRFTVQDFFAMYPDADTCLEHVFRTRFGDKPECPKCGRVGQFHKLAKLPAYTCTCGHHIHPMVGTPFAKTHTPLHRWFYAMYLFCMSRHGVPAKELQRQLGVTYKTAWRMGHELRKYMGEVDGNDPLSGHVEVDETYIGGRVRGKGRGLQMENKAVVVGMVQRDGDLMMWATDRVRKREIHGAIRQNVKTGSRISADDSPIYDDLHGHGYNVQRINHSAKEWVRGVVHTNTIEGVWSQIKRSIRGTHVAVSRKHLWKYLAEFEYRWNMRNRPTEMLPRLLRAL